MYFDQIKAELVEAQEVLNKFVSADNNIKLIEKAAKLLAESFKNGGKVLSCGNGGSHCDAMHFAEELTGRYRENRPGYPAIAISDVSHLSCVVMTLVMNMFSLALLKPSVKKAMFYLDYRHQAILKIS